MHLKLSTEYIRVDLRQTSFEPIMALEPPRPPMTTVACKHERSLVCGTAQLVVDRPSLVAKRPSKAVVTHFKSALEKEAWKLIIIMKRTRRQCIWGGVLRSSTFQETTAELLLIARSISPYHPSSSLNPLCFFAPPSLTKSKNKSVK